MKQIILAHGLKRSGLHGVLNWVQAHGSFHFFNNLIPQARLLSGEKEFPEQLKFDDWLAGELAVKRAKLRGRISLRRLRKAAIFGVSRFMGLLEDHELSVCPFTDPPCKVQNILILRDPVNLFASRIHKSALRPGSLVYPDTNNEFMQRATNLWKKHAREFIGETDELQNRVGIYYNRWFTDRAYREQISGQLGMRFKDSGFGRLSKHGGGSSFDGKKIESKVEDLSVLSRSKQLSEEHAALLEEVIDDEMKELAAELEKVASS